jgi:hypothetical protein
MYFVTLHPPPCKLAKHHYEKEEESQQSPKRIGETSGNQVSLRFGIIKNLRRATGLLLANLLILTKTKSKVTMSVLLTKL